MKDLRHLKTLRELFSKTTEKNAPEWDSSVLVSIASGGVDAQTAPEALNDNSVLIVSDTRSAAVLLRPSDDEAVYGVTVYGWCASSKSFGSGGSSEPMAGVYELDGGVWEDLSGPRILGIDCQLYEGIYVHVDALDTGRLDVEIVSVPFETP